MPDFSTNNVTRTPFGRNEYLRSTQDVKTESAMVAKGSVPAQTIDGFDGQKVLQTGTVIAKITSGADSGKFGPYNRNAADGREVTDNIVGISDTFLPWQLMERDCEIATVYEASVVQAWCFEYIDEGVYNGGAFGGVASGTMIAIPLSDTTRDAMVALANLGIRFL